VSTPPTPYRDETAVRREREVARREEAARVAMEGVTAEMIFTQGDAVHHGYLHRGEQGEKDKEKEKEEGAGWVACQTIRPMDTILEEPEPRFRDEEFEELGRNEGTEEYMGDGGDGIEEGGGGVDAKVLGSSFEMNVESVIGEGDGIDGMNGSEEEMAQRREGGGGGRGGGGDGGGDLLGESISASVSSIAECLLGGHRASRLKKVTVSQIEIDTHVSHILNFSFPRSSFGSDLWRENR
jgi:hypothetical protein